MINFITMRKIEFNRYQISKYVITSLFFSRNNDVIIITSSREIHIVDDFKINVLIKMNIMILEKIDILVFQVRIKIKSC